MNSALADGWLTESREERVWWMDAGGGRCSKRYPGRVQPIASSNRGLGMPDPYVEVSGPRATRCFIGPRVGHARPLRRGEARLARTRPRRPRHRVVEPPNTLFRVIDLPPPKPVISASKLGAIVVGKECRTLMQFRVLVVEERLVLGMRSLSPARFTGCRNPSRLPIDDA